MAGGLVALLDDVAVLARAAAASVDDIGAAAAKASAKAAGVVVDDTAVTPQYVHGLAAERELPIIRRIAVGSLRNKLLIILPAILLLSQFLPWLLTPILMLGGAYLCYEGAEKVWHKLRPAMPTTTPRAEEALPDENTIVSGAVRTDFILSAEIMVISLNEVADQAFVSRAIILVVVALGITVLVYGVVGLIVKMDDVGLHLSERSEHGRGPVRPRPGQGDAEAADRPHRDRHRRDALGRRPHPAGGHRRPGPAPPLRRRPPPGGDRARRRRSARRARGLAGQHAGQRDPRARRRRADRASS